MAVVVLEVGVRTTLPEGVEGGTNQRAAETKQESSRSVRYLVRLAKLFFPEREQKSCFVLFLESFSSCLRGV